MSEKRSIRLFCASLVCKAELGKDPNLPKTEALWDPPKMVSADIEVVNRARLETLGFDSFDEH